MQPTGDNPVSKVIVAHKLFKVAVAFVKMCFPRDFFQWCLTTETQLEIRNDNERP